MPDKIWLRMFRDLGLQDEVVVSKRERIRIPKFGYQEAFELAALTRKLAKEEFSKRPVVIDISLPNGHSLTRIGNDMGSALHDDCWIQRKQKTAIGFGCSSFIMGHRVGFGSRRKREFLDSKGYAFDGGALPIFIESCEYPVACLTISGLEVHEDHWLAFESVADYMIKINNLAGKYMADLALEGHTIYCAICLSEVRYGAQCYVVPCRHMFHRQCLGVWGKYTSRCPVCASQIPNEYWIFLR